MTTLLLTHAACLGHDPGRSHPERPDRLNAILDRLATPSFAPLKRKDAPLADKGEIARIHRADFVDRVLAAIPTEGRNYLDPDTAVSPGSKEAALRAAGACIAAVDAVMTGDADNAFCAVRPPGHHAEAGRAMGFCLFNNVAVGAIHARAAHGIRRVAVMDFDVHHGNGTQAMFWSDAELFYASTHQFPHYPGTGARGETGAHGNVVNAPLPAGSGSAEFHIAMTDRVLPALDAFKPELVMISAGFDAHAADPLADLYLDEEDFGWATSELVKVAKRHCSGKVVSTLEGGYDLAALANSAAAHVAALMAA
jgi:acetoin utilization deacetylase AcuC-like enzyme